MIQRHKTAIGRTDLSRPFRLALAAGLIRGADSVLDYGCGRGDDVRSLQALGFDCVGWDPVHAPEGEKRESDVVNLGYVLNVIEDPEERTKTLRAAWGLARRALIVAARVDIQAQPQKAEEHGDGVVTSRSTFQKFYTQTELRGWLDDELDSRSVAAGPGIFFIFRDQTDRHRFASALVRRRLSAPFGHVSEALFEENRTALEPLVDFFRERGRLPHPDELSTAAELTFAFGSIPKAFRAVRNVLADEAWDEAEEARRNDLLVYLALERFGKRPRFGELPLELQYDIKAFWGAYTRACGEADALLFSLGDAELVSDTCASAPVGKVTAEALYVHTEGLELLPPRLRLFEGCARVMVGEVEGANIIKLDRTRPKVSYLSYPDFDDLPHPTLSSSVVVWLDTMAAKLYDFSGRENPPILHRKESFVPADYPRRQLFARLTRQEEKRGLLEKSGIGTLKPWNELLEEKGVRLAGHVLRKA